MSLLLILGVFGIWGYAIWVFKRKGDLPWEDNTPPDMPNSTSEAFQPKRRLTDHSRKKKR